MITTALLGNPNVVKPPFLINLPALINMLETGQV